jgi:DNA-binding MarR family transcriptional regulator
MALAGPKGKTQPKVVKREARTPAPAKTAAKPGMAKPGTGSAETSDGGLSRQIIWDLVSISNHLEEMRRCWARLFGISGPQWLILLAVNDLDEGAGVSVGEVSVKIHAVATFVTKESKVLEKRGFLDRVSSESDGRVVLMSLSEQAHRQFGAMSERWNALHEFMFSDFDAATWRDVKFKLELLKKRSRMAVQRASEELEN